MSLLVAVQQHPGQDQNDFRVQTLRNDWFSFGYFGRQRRAGGAGVHPPPQTAAHQYSQARATLPDQHLAPQFFVARN
jgi:hypothetical protein